MILHARHECTTLVTTTQDPRILSPPPCTLLEPESTASWKLSHTQPPWSQATWRWLISDGRPPDPALTGPRQGHRIRQTHVCPLVSSLGVVEQTVPLVPPVTLVPGA